MSYGYRVGEVVLPTIAPLKPGTIFGEFIEITLRDRPVMRGSLGCHLIGAARPVPDTNDPANMKAGSAKRFCANPPKGCPIRLRRLRRFVRAWVRKNLVPLARDSDISYRTWLAGTNYTVARQKELIRKIEANPDMKLRKNRCVKMFLKDENYPEYKYPRGINARVDEFKCAVGPIFKLIEKELFKLDWFIKKIPVNERPAYILNKLGHANRFMASDYSSFEALFTRELMMACEYELYSYMVQDLPGGDEWLQLVREVIMGNNELHNKFFKILIEATRMSGEMNTSLGNSFSNLMFTLFLAEENGCDNVEGVVEGDDGLFTMSGPFPTAKDYESLGLTIKIEEHDNLAKAAFCSLLFDVEDMVNITDPIKVLQSFGWCQSNYAGSSLRRKKELLRCKALSVIYQYNGAPVLMALAKYGLRATHGVRPRPGYQGTCAWERELIAQVLKTKTEIKEVGMKSRLLVEEKFGLSVEHQLAIEAYLDSLNELQPLQHHLITLHSTHDQEHYYHNYVRVVDLKSPLSREPTFGANSLAHRDVVITVAGK